MFKRPSVHPLFAAIGLLLAWPVAALNLTEAVQLALRSDPIYLSAQANARASHERTSQATANLLPQVSATANTIYNRRSYQVRDGDQTVTEDRYNSNNAQLNVTQPLWRHANWIARTQATAAAAQADYQRAAAEQDLLLRLAQAWFDMMLARDVVFLSRTQVDAAKQQLEQIKRAFKLEMVSGVVVEEAKTKYEQAEAELAGAQADQVIKLSALEQIIGTADIFSPPTLSEGYLASDPRAGTLEQWLRHAEENSPHVLAALNGLDAANEEVRKQSAGHQPTLDLVASYGRNSQQAGSFPGQNGFNILQSTIGVQLNVPLYSGGGQSAKVDEALALRDKALMDLESAKRSVRHACRQAWFGWQASHMRLSAAQQSMRFATLNLNSAIHGKSNELKTELDVLQARQQISSSIRDLQKARYDMITNQLRLKASSGELLNEDLSAFDTWLVQVDDPVRLPSQDMGGLSKPEGSAPQPALRGPQGGAPHPPQAEN